MRYQQLIGSRFPTHSSFGRGKTIGKQDVWVNGSGKSMSQPLIHKISPFMSYCLSMKLGVHANRSGKHTTVWSRRKREVPSEPRGHSDAGGLTGWRDRLLPRNNIAGRCSFPRVG